MFLSTDLKINGARLWDRLMRMGEIGATLNGGCNRQALTDADLEGRNLLARWATELGCSVRIDPIGNLFVRRSGLDDSLPVVMTGSHLDTQPTGGKFDGIYGVLAGLEVIEVLHERGIVTRHPLEVCVWCNEEGCRFPVSMMGSAVWSGRLSLADAHALSDRAGVTVGEELRRLGVPGDAPMLRQAVKAALELHIEQGPVLEQRGRTIGVVTGVQNMARYQVVVYGQEAHAGPTPMRMRRDPVRVLGEVLPALYAAAERCAPDGRVTFGIIETFPGSPNTIPGKLNFTVDLRHPNAEVYKSLCAEAESIFNAALERYRLTGEMRCVWEAPGVSFDGACIDAVRKATAALGFDALELTSGAGHDSCNIADIAPTSMIFVPCGGGLSHNEAESATPAHVEAGANVLLHALLALAQ